MSADLFGGLPESKSPRLLWMERHRAEVRATPRWEPGFEDEDGDPLHQFYASVLGYTERGGGTEDEALAKAAKAAGVRLWNETGWQTNQRYEN